MNTTNHRHMQTSAANQKGVVLIVGLVLLIALTILGVNALSTTSLEQRMAGNMGDINLAFNASETASRAAQSILMQRISFLESSNGPCTNQTTRTGNLDLCVIEFDKSNWWEGKTPAWWETNGLKLAGTLSDIKSQPRIVIETPKPENKPPTGIEYVQGGHTQKYRITARGTGISDNSEAIVQQTIFIRYR